MPSGDLQSLKEGNVKALVSALYAASHPLSITDLHKTTGLSRPTIESNLKTIEERGLLKTVSKPSKKSSGGRPARSFTLDYDAGIVAGITLGVEEVTVVIANLAGKLLTSTSLPVAAKDRRPSIALNLLSQALQMAERQTDQLRCVTVGVIGETTALGRRLHVDRFPELSSEAFFSEFAANFDCPVIYRNDADLAALAEFHQLKDPAKVMVGINISGAFGAGIIINSQLFTGAQSGAAEMGHDNSLGWPEAFTQFTKVREREHLTVRGIYSLAHSGDKAALQAVETFIATAVPGVRALICAFDPDLVVISGYVTLLGDLPCRILRQELQKTLPYVPPIELSPLQGLSVETGSIDCCIQHLKENSYGIFGYEN